MPETILEMRNVTKRFPGVKALSDVSIEVRKGEIHALVGENGAGKSTLMKVLSGAYNAHEFEGEIWVDGKKQTFESTRDAKACGIEMVYQEMNMMLDATVAENIYVGNLPGGAFVDFKTLYANAQKALDQINLDFGPKDIVRTLNGGQMQMLAIMRAIAKNPRIIVMDEPTSALTNDQVDLLMDFLDNMRKQGVSCLFITHKLEEVYRICDRVTVMRDGQTVFTSDVKDASEDALIEGMIGRKIDNMYAAGTGEFGEEILRVEGLSVPHPTYHKRNIVENINFSLRKGEILGIGGLVGAGRSETIGALFGQITKDVKKKVFINGKEVNISCPRDAINAGLGFVPEDRKRNGFTWVFSILHNMTLAALPELPGRFFINRKAEREAAKGPFERMKVRAPSLNTPIVNLSGGNQQKVILGKWLLKNAPILLVDEPTRGVDVGSKAEIYTIMRELCAQGVSIIMVSSDLPELVSMSDRCLVISNGMITAELTGDDITQNNVMRAAIATAKLA